MNISDPNDPNRSREHLDPRLIELSARLAAETRAEQDYATTSPHIETTLTRTDDDRGLVTIAPAQSRTQSVLRLFAVITLGALMGLASFFLMRKLG